MPCCEKIGSRMSSRFCILVMSNEPRPSGPSATMPSCFMTSTAASLRPLDVNQNGAE
jgi:hypothetical protein